MGKLREILDLAKVRAEGLERPYQGELTPREAFEIWQAAPGARMVDVRTRAEWDWVGRIPGAVEIGYNNCYNVLEGFEGDKDASGHRNTVGGWRRAGLPWHQG
jgi:rhodanese-related sulfurtransferase